MNSLDIIVFTQYPRAYAPKRLVEEAHKIGLSIKVVGYSDVDILNLEAANTVILREPNPVNGLYQLRDKILKHYRVKGVRVLNSNSYKTWSVLDKITQESEFVKGDISHIKTIDIRQRAFPFIAKNKLGSHGDSVYKIENSEDLNEVLAKHKMEDLLFQEFQVSGFDLRAIVLGGAVLGVMKRTPKSGEFLSNYSQGGMVESFKADKNTQEEVNKLAIKAANHFKLEYVGVDLMQGNDGSWRVLEVNRACQFKGFELSTGKNVAQSLIEFLTQK